MKKKKMLTTVASLVVASLVLITCKKDNFVEQVGFCPTVGQYMVVLSSSPTAGGTTTGAGVYNAGEIANISATPNVGYEFTTWTGDTTSILQAISVLVDTNKNITANFKLSSSGNCPTVVELGLAGNFTIFAKAGISATGLGDKFITGNIGVNPVTSTSITGFGLILPAGGAFATSSLVDGKVYAPDYAVPSPANMVTTTNDMETAYTTANGLTTPAPISAGGDISGQTLVPGIYKTNTDLLISDVGTTLDGGGDNCATFIFQIAGNLTVASAGIVHLQNGAQAKNIFWVVAGNVALGTTVDFSGNVLCKTGISVLTGTKVTGRLLAQTAVTLDGGFIVKPE
jgi:hypothetical protein